MRYFYNHSKKCYLGLRLVKLDGEDPKAGEDMNEQGKGLNGLGCRGPVEDLGDSSNPPGW